MEVDEKTIIDQFEEVGDTTKSYTKKKVVGLSCEEVYEVEDENKKLCEIFNVDSAYFARERIVDLGLSVRAYNCLSRFMDPPLCSPTGCHMTVDELLEIKLGCLKKIRNLGKKCCLEILEKLSCLTNNNEIVKK